MSQMLPVNGFKWVENTFTLMNILQEAIMKIVMKNIF